LYLAQIHIELIQLRQRAEGPAIWTACNCRWFKN